MTGILTALILLSSSGLICGALLAIASVFMSTEKDEGEVEIRAVLPGVNCGACGYGTCDGYAAALASDNTVKTNLCIPGADSVAEKLSQLTGAPYEGVVERIAYVKCGGGCSQTVRKHHYEGYGSCSAANMLYGGIWGCEWACQGFGDCVLACPDGAISIVDGMARVNARKCTGCGICVSVCPKGIIEMFYDSSRVIVTCSNHDKGAVARKKCKRSCIACRRCEKACPTDAIKVEDNLAVINYELCTGCGECARVCPTGCIEYADFRGVHNINNKM
ncbi:MAG: RnfABCDGE type electron transport complex subunit B [Eubacteriales bacterium]|jgi:electron transport complex protein RnfB|nr:RnfABCDGE type electron transport complex subunit B [Clostridiales bacterium]